MGSEMRQVEVMQSEKIVRSHAFDGHELIEKSYFHFFKYRDQEQQGVDAKILRNHYKNNEIRKNRMRSWQALGSPDCGRLFGALAGPQLASMLGAAPTSKLAKHRPCLLKC